MKLRIYLDTSVFSAYEDDRAPERKNLAMEFWRRLDDFEVSTSEIARQELDTTPELSRRESLIRLLNRVAVHPMTPEMGALARIYVDGGVFSPTALNDALHVAAAVLTRQDILVSWNFRHLVNRRRRALINDLNVRGNLPTIEIVAPPEV
jgi:predicted nucleic acid-binding protein